MKRISVLIFSLCFPLALSAQEGELATSPAEPAKEVTMADTIPWYVRMNGLRVGIDIGGPINKHIFKSYSENYSIVADYEIKDNWYLTAQIGTSKFERGIVSDEPVPQSYNYSLSGQFVKLGFDYSLIHTDNPYDKDMISIGMRLSGASFKHHLDNLSYSDPYYGTSITGSIPSESLIAIWAEAVLGAKAEIADNLFLGAYVSLRMKLSCKEGERIHDVQYIPAYGKGFKPVNCGLGFTISYLIPFQKKHLTYIRDLED